MCLTSGSRLWRPNMRPATRFVKRVNTTNCATHLGQSLDVGVDCSTERFSDAPVSRAYRSRTTGFLTAVRTALRIERTIGLAVLKNLRDMRDRAKVWQVGRPTCGLPVHRQDLRRQIVFFSQVARRTRLPHVGASAVPFRALVDLLENPAIADRK